MTVDVAQLDGLEHYVRRPENCLPQYWNVFNDVVTDNGLQMPTNLTEAGQLYSNMMDQIYNNG